MKKVLAVLFIYLCLAMMCTGAYGAYYDEGNDGDSWETAYVIDSVEDFMLMRERTGSSSKTKGERGKYYKITADLDVSSEAGMNTASSFSGHIDGQNHTLKINIQNNIGGTIFMQVSADQVAIRNLNVTGNCKGSQIAGILHTLSTGTVENCSFTGTLEGEIVGGIAVAISDGTSVKNCTFSGQIIASGTSASAGGIVGQLRGGSIENCTVSSGTVITCNPTNELASGFVGGIAAMTMSVSSAPSITNCTSYAILEGNLQYKGGIVGSDNNPYFPALILSGNTWPNQYQEVGFSWIGNNTPVPSPYPITSQDNNTAAKLETAVISPIVLSDEVIAKLAQNISVDPSELILLTSADFDPSEPPEPTNAMRQKVQGQFMAKLNTINVSKDGWYVFMVTVSDDLVGTKVGDLRLYGAEASDFTASSFNAAFGLMPIVNGITGGLEISNFFGVKLDTLPKQFLATMFLSASQSLTVYIVKILLLLLGGCDAGFGVIGGGLMMIVGGIFAVRFIKRKRR